MARLLFTAAYIYAASPKPAKQPLPPVVRPMPIIKGMRKNAVTSIDEVMYAGSVDAMHHCGPESNMHNHSRTYKKNRLVRVKPIHRDFM